MAELSNTETLYLSTLRPSGEAVGSLLAAETSFAARAEWQRMSDDKGNLVVILLDNGGVNVNTPRRVTLPAGRSLYLYAKSDTSDEAQTVVAGPFTASGSTAADYAFTATLDLAIDSALWNDEGKLNLAVAFTVEDTSGGTNPSSYPASLVLTRSPLGEGTPSNATVFLRKALNLSDLASAPTALTNLGGTTVGKAVFIAVDAAAARAAIGAGTGSGDLVDAGTITLANAGKLVQITALKTLGVGPEYTSANTQFALAQRDVNGGFSATYTQTGAVRVDGTSGACDFQLANGTPLGTFTSYSMAWTIPISTEVEVNSPSFKALTTDGATLKTSAGTTVATWGVGGSTDFTLSGIVIAEGYTGPSCDIEDGQFNDLSIVANSFTVNNKQLTAPASAGTLATLDGTETLTNKTITSPAIGNIVTVSNGNLTITPNGTGLTYSNRPGRLGSVASNSTNLGWTLYNTADEVTNYERASVYWDSNFFTINTSKAGTGNNRGFRVYANGTTYFEVAPLGGSTSGMMSFTQTTSSTVNGGAFKQSGFISTASSGNTFGNWAAFTANQSGTTTNNWDLIAVTETALGSGAQMLWERRAGASGTTSMGSLTNKGILRAAGAVVLPAYTVATLPATAALGMVAGAVVAVTDALAPAWNVAIAGGGAIHCGARYNGAAWVAC